jgi:hypothetical protein
LFGICKKYEARVYEDGDDAVGVLGLVCMKDRRAFACPERFDCPILNDDFDVDWFEVKEKTKKCPRCGRDLELTRIVLPDGTEHGWSYCHSYSFNEALKGFPNGFCDYSENVEA